MEKVCLFNGDGYFLVSSFDVKDLREGDTLYVCDLCDWWKGKVIAKANRLEDTRGDFVGSFDNIMIAFNKEEKVPYPPSHKKEYNRFLKAIKPQWQPSDKYSLTYFNGEETAEDELQGNSPEELAYAFYIAVLGHVGLNTGYVKDIIVTPIQDDIEEEY